jgi:ADP-heptose:LPS heptosyltransferase
LIHPGSGSIRKNWHISNFIKVCSILESYGMNPEFILGPAEDFFGEKLQEQHTVHIVYDLPELVLMLKKAGGFIGNDSGITHVSAFMGVPTVSVFGPSDPEIWRPVGPAVKIVRINDLRCSPCFETPKIVCDKMECLDRISPMTVIKAFCEFRFF